MDGQGASMNAAMNPFGAWYTRYCVGETIEAQVSAIDELVMVLILASLFKRFSKGIRSLHSGSPPR